MSVLRHHVGEMMSGLRHPVEVSGRACAASGVRSGDEAARGRHGARRAGSAGWLPGWLGDKRGLACSEFLWTSAGGSEAARARGEDGRVLPSSFCTCFGSTEMVRDE